MSLKLTSARPRSVVSRRLPFLDSRHLDGPERVCEQRSRWRCTAVNFGAEAPIFDPFDASTDETLAAAGSFAVILFITLFSPFFKMKSLYSTPSEYFCIFYFPFKDLRTALHLLVGEGDGVFGCQTDPRQAQVHARASLGGGRIASSLSETPRPPSCARGVSCRWLNVTGMISRLRGVSLLT